MPFGTRRSSKAPLAYVFDSYDQIHLLPERLFLRSAGNNRSMPPGPNDPPQGERDMLAEWIACAPPHKNEALSGC